jgi:hypothetical protein
LLHQELRAGIRRYGESERGAAYQSTVAHKGEGSAHVPRVAARTLGDLLDPYRAERVVDVVNAVTRSVGDDVAAWDWYRIVTMYGQLEAAERQRERQAE